MSDDADMVVEGRRRLLREWIDSRYGGVQAAFIEDTGINQGELSGLLKSKSFGEKRARSLEKKARMPPFHLDRPQLGAAEESAEQSHSHSMRLDPEIVASAHEALRDMYALKERTYHEDDVARFLLLYEKYAMRKAGVSEAELLGAGLDDSGMPQGATSERNDGVPDAGTDKRTVARRVRRKA